MEKSVRELGITAVTRPVGARLLGLSRFTLNRHIADDRIAVAGRVHKIVSVADIEEIRGRPVTAEELVIALASAPEPKFAPPAKPERHLMDIVGDYTDYLRMKNVSPSIAR